MKKFLHPTLLTSLNPKTKKNYPSIYLQPAVIQTKCIHYSGFRPVLPEKPSRNHWLGQWRSEMLLHLFLHTVLSSPTKGLYFCRLEQLNIIQLWKAPVVSSAGRPTFPTGRVTASRSGSCRSVSLPGDAKRLSAVHPTWSLYSSTLQE